MPAPIVETSPTARPRTLIFCTAFAESYPAWRRRYRRWLEAIRAGGLHHDQILLIDDASPVLPNWPDLAVAPADDAALPEGPLVMARFATHLGKVEGPSHSPGWFRSFAYAARHADAGGFAKLIHIESDAFVLSARLEAYLNELRDGWIGLWCPLHEMPEDNIQVVAGRALKVFADFARRDYRDFAGDTIENQYPFTRVERRFVGDRYGEYRPDVPRHADFVAQVRQGPAVPESYFRWLAERLPAAARERIQVAQPSASARPASYDDVVAAYNLVLFRDPDSLATLAYLVGTPIVEVIAGLMLSAEFRDVVLEPLLAGDEPAFRGGTPATVMPRWLFHALLWDEDGQKALLSTQDRAALLRQTLHNPDLVRQLLCETGATPLFDPPFYASSRGRSFGTFAQAVRDYLKEGAAAGANPNPLFDTDWYRARHLGEAAINPLVHFFVAGSFALLPTARQFDPRRYAREALDEMATGVKALAHRLAADPGTPPSA